MMRRLLPSLLLICFLLAACSGSATQPPITVAGSSSTPTAAQAASGACKVSPIIPDPDPAITKVIPAVTQADHIRGKVDARFTILEYSDFQ